MPQGQATVCCAGEYIGRARGRELVVMCLCVCVCAPVWVDICTRSHQSGL